MPISIHIAVVAEARSDIPGGRWRTLNTWWRDADAGATGSGATGGIEIDNANETFYGGEGFDVMRERPALVVKLTPRSQWRASWPSLLPAAVRAPGAIACAASDNRDTLPRDACDETMRYMNMCAQRFEEVMAPNSCTLEQLEASTFEKAFRRPDYRDLKKVVNHLWKRALHFHETGRVRVETKNDVRLVYWYFYARHDDNKAAVSALLPPAGTSAASTASVEEDDDDGESSSSSSSSSSSDSEYGNLETHVCKVDGGEDDCDGDASADGCVDTASLRVALHNGEDDVEPLLNNGDEEDDEADEEDGDGGDKEEESSKDEDDDKKEEEESSKDDDASHATSSYEYEYDSDEAATPKASGSREPINAANDAATLAHALHSNEAMDELDRLLLEIEQELAKRPATTTTTTTTTTAGPNVVACIASMVVDDGGADDGGADDDGDLKMSASSSSSSSSVSSESSSTSSSESYEYEYEYESSSESSSRTSSSESYEYEYEYESSSESSSSTSSSESYEYEYEYEYETSETDSDDEDNSSEYSVEEVSCSCDSSCTSSDSETSSSSSSESDAVQLDDDVVPLLSASHALSTGLRAQFADRRSVSLPELFSPHTDASDSDDDDDEDGNDNEDDEDECSSLPLPPPPPPVATEAQTDDDDDDEEASSPIPWNEHEASDRLYRAFLADVGGDQCDANVCAAAQTPQDCSSSSSSPLRDDHQPTYSSSIDDELDKILADLTAPVHGGERDALQEAIDELDRMAAVDLQLEAEHARVQRAIDDEIKRQIERDAWEQCERQRVENEWQLRCQMLSFEENEAYEQAYEESVREGYEQAEREREAYEETVREREAYEQAEREREAYEQAEREREAYEQAEREREAFEQAEREREAYERHVAEQQQVEQNNKAAHVAIDIAAPSSAQPWASSSACRVPTQYTLPMGCTYVLVGRDDGELRAGSEWLATELQKQTGLPVDLHHIEAPLAPRDRYRVARRLNEADPHIERALVRVRVDGTVHCPDMVEFVHFVCTHTHATVVLEYGDSIARLFDERESAMPLPWPFEYLLLCPSASYNDVEAAFTMLQRAPGPDAYENNDLHRRWLMLIQEMRIGDALLVPCTTTTGNATGAATLHGAASATVAAAAVVSATAPTRPMVVKNVFPEYKTKVE